MDADFEKAKSKWEKQRARGKLSYVLLYILLYILLGLAVQGINLLLFNRSSLFKIPLLLCYGSVAVVIGGAAGALIGHFFWRGNEKRFGC